MKQLLFSASTKMYKKKQLFSRFMIVLVTIISSTEAKSQYAIAKNEDGITLFYDYINDGKELELVQDYDVQHVTNYPEVSGKVLRIPSEVTFQNRTRKVTRIGARSLAYAQMVEVVLPPTIKSIGAKAFYGCDKLKVLNIPDNTEIIEEDAFSRVYLNKLTVGKGLKKVEHLAFGASLQSDSVIVCDLYSFFQIDYNNVNFFNGGKNLLFDSNYNLITDLVLPEGITKIGKTIKGCKSIKSVRIPKSITEIDNYAFEDCINLSNIHFHDNITKIGEYAFEYLPITSIKLPKNLVSIESGAFYRCPLSEIEIPDKVEEILSTAFFDTCLQLVIIPKSILT